VQVAHGGFSVLLGSITPLGTGFDGPLYLGISAPGEPEMAPRTALSSSPYALGLRLPFQVSATAGTPLMNGYAYGNFGGALDLLAPGGGTLTGIEPHYTGMGGYLYVNGGSGYAFVDGNAGAAHSPALGVTGPGSTTIFDSNSSGDLSVLLPANAISAAEILDEPGIAQNLNTGGVAVPVGGTMADIITVTITTPAVGYITVEATGQHGIGGSSSSTSNYAELQIDETAGGGLDPSHNDLSGYFGAVAGIHNGGNYQHIALRRTYYKPAGTYTFRLEGLTVQNELLSNYIWQPLITATYYPTSYGTVTAAPALAEASQFSSRRVTTAMGNAPGQPDVQCVTVDLRELELRDAKAAADAERAHLQLVEARLAQQTQARTAAQAAARAATQAQK
jgi:hypothetical protein